ncbi:hypothetical protein OHB24_03440 [Kribbella sp. NBC_00482]|uniref:hypothetical protein n=1 Tax=Kribbella sp. NBC_00482 TaxID=2975968 RepID=UPI002E180E84
MARRRESRSAFAVLDGSVELDDHAVLLEQEVDAGDEYAVVVADLRLRQGSRQTEIRHGYS